MASGNSKRSATAEAPPPPPPPTPASKTASAQPEKIEAKHMGADAFRPLRYIGSFVWGTIKGTLNGMATGGRRGLILGIVAGIALAYLPFILGAGAVSISLSGVLFGGAAQVATGTASAFASVLFENIFAGMAVGAIGGAALKGFFGAVTGGAREVGRSYRKEKYADELATRQEARTHRAQRHISYDDRHAHSREAASFNLDRLAQQDRRAENEVRTYWQDRVGNEGHSGGRGF